MFSKTPLHRETPSPPPTNQKAPSRGLFSRYLLCDGGRLGLVDLNVGRGGGALGSELEGVALAGDSHQVTGQDAAVEDTHRERVLQEVLDGTAHGTGTLLDVVTLLHQQGAG